MAGGRTVSIDLVARDLLTGAMEDAARSVQRLQRNLDELNRRVSVQVDADTERAQQGLERTSDEARRLDGKDVNVKVDADTGGAIAGLGGVRAALAGLGAVSLVPLASGLASIGAAAAAAGIGIGGIAAVAIPAFSNIKKALDAQTQAQQNAGAAAAQSQSRALALAGAQQQVASAVRQAAQAHTQALEQVRQAEERLTQAHQSEASAARDLAQARADARRQLEDVANNAADARLSERQAILDVADAQANLNKVMADPKASDTDRKRAQLQLDQARQIVKERHLAVLRAVEDEKAAKKAGVDGSDAVRSARERLAQADQAVANAERQVAQARAGVARTDQQSADAIASARRSLAAASLQGAAGNAALASSMAALSGPQRVLMGQVLSLKSAFDSWRTALEPKVLPLFGKGIEIIKNILPTLTPFVTAATTAIGGFLDHITAVTKSAGFASFMKQLAATVGPTLTAALKGVGDILGSLAPLFLTLAQAGAKIIGPFLGAINQIVGALASALAPVLKAMTPVFNQLVGALGPLISQLVSGLSPILAGLAPVLSELFGVLQPVISQLISGLQPVIQSLVPVVGLLVGALGKILLSLTPLLPPLGKLISTLVTGLLPVLTPIVTVIAQTAAQIGGALVQALVACMPAIQQMVLSVAKLLPLLTPLIPLFGQVILAVIPLIPPLVNLAAQINKLLIPIVGFLIKVLVKLEGTLLKFVIPAVKAVVAIIGWFVRKIAESIPQMGRMFSRFYSEWIKPAMDKAGQVVRGVWENWIRPAFDRIRSAVGKVQDAFGTAVEGIKRVWSRLKDVAKIPVNFVIGTIYNRGIRPLVNGIAHLVGMKGSPLASLPTFDRGGIYPGYTPGRDIGLAAVSGGEAIMRPEFTRAVGPGFVHEANKKARSGGPAAVRRWLSGPGALGGEGIAFSRGGMVPRFAGAFAGGGIVPGFLKGLKNFAFGNVGKAAKGALDRITGGNVPGSGFFRDVIAKLPGWLAHKILGWATGKIGEGTVGGKGMRNALNWARSQAGKPYVWGGVGPGGYDCSGFMSAITNVIHGKSPYSRLFSTMSFGNSGGPGGFVRNLRSGFMVGVTNAGVGHMAGTLLGTNVESSGSRGVHLGPGARGFNDPLFGYRYGLKADTGALELRPGWNPPTYNGTGGKELLTTRQASGGNTYNLHFADDRNMYEKGKEFARGLEEYKRRGGRIPTP